MRDTLEIMSMRRSAYNWAMYIIQTFFTLQTGGVLFLGFVLANPNAYDT